MVEIACDTHLIPDVVVPDRVGGEVVQRVAVIVLDDVDGETALAVVRSVVTRHGPARDPQGSAN